MLLLPLGFIYRHSCPGRPRPPTDDQRSKTSLNLLSLHWWSVRRSSGRSSGHWTFRWCFIPWPPCSKYYCIPNTESPLTVILLYLVSFECTVCTLKSAAVSCWSICTQSVLVNVNLELIIPGIGNKGALIKWHWKEYVTSTRQPWG